MKKRLFFLFFLLFLALPLIGLAEAQPGPQLELEYPELILPEIGEFRIHPGMLLHELAQFIFYFLVIIGGVIAFISLIYSGILRLTSAGNPAKISKAKKQFKFSFLGLTLLLGSWLILHTIDPELVKFPRFEGAAALKRPDPVQPEPLKDGLIFVTTHPDPLLQRIEVPGADIRVSETRRFPIKVTRPGPLGEEGRERRVTVTSIDIDGKEPNYKNRITHLIIINPRPRRRLEEGYTPRYPRRYFYKHPDHQYGVACFEHPNFQGRVRIITEQDFISYHGIVWLDNIAKHKKGEQVDEKDLKICLNIPQWGDKPPCGSILVFVMPPSLSVKGADYYTDDLLCRQEDRIIFYEHNAEYRKRIIRQKVNEEITEKEEIIGECLRIDSIENIEDSPEKKCPRFWRLCPTISPWHRVTRGGIRGWVPGSLKMTRPGKNGAPFFPESMEIKVPEGQAGKYLVFLFQTWSRFRPPRPWAPLKISPHWDHGNAYWFTSSVPDFGDRENPDLYWHHLPLPYPRLIESPKHVPQSAIIIRIKRVF